MDFRVNAQIKVGPALYLSAWTIVPAETKADAMNQVQDEIRKHTATIQVLNAKEIKEESND